MSTREMLQKAAGSVLALQKLSDVDVSKVLLEVASALRSATGDILAANALDLSRMDPENPKYDRLKLTTERIDGIASDMENVATLPSPLGKVLSEAVRPNGMTITKVSVPFGVIGVIYEARPNVTADVFSLCFRSGNVSVLKGGSDADDSSRAIVKVIHEVLERNGIDTSVCALLPAAREATAELLGAVGLVDLIIPRGSSTLINFVRENARIPVIETGAGICHTYFDKSGDVQKGMKIILNAKTRRVSVCNALDCLVMHLDRLDDLAEICQPLAEQNVIIYADEPSYAALNGKYPTGLLQPAADESFGTEFLDYKMSICASTSLQGAIDHITLYGSGHSECIVTEKNEVADYFTRAVDAACVYVNVPTSFTDGGEFGLGAEIGISTQKLHARGPMGLDELNTYKWVIRGEGQTRK